MSSSSDGELPKLTSVDDQVIGPPNVWTDRLPSKFQESGPRVERKKLAEISHVGGGSYDLEIVADDQEGTWGDVWFYEGQPTYGHKRNTIIPRSAISHDGGHTSLNMSGMDLSPITYEEMIPGCYDPAERLKLVGEDNVTFETDFPHTDTTWPNTKAYPEKVLAGLSEVQKYKIMRGNAIKMLSLDTE